MRGTVGQVTTRSSVDPGHRSSIDAGGLRNDVTGFTLEATRVTGTLAVTGWY